MKKSTSLRIILLSIVFLMGCLCTFPVLSPTPGASTSTGIGATQTSTTQVQAPTLAQVPTQVPTPGTIASAVPTLPPGSLNAAGPWFIFWGNDGLYAMNLDGSGISKVFDDQSDYSHYQLSSVAPTGGTLAITHYGDLMPENLILVKLPGGNILRQFSIMTNNLHYIAWSAGDSVWSPDGTQLAFISAENGTSADVYLYSPATDQVTRLTSGSSQSAYLSWSPDGKYIFNVAVNGFGTGAGESVAGVWAVTPAGNNIYLYDPYPYKIPPADQTQGWPPTSPSAGEYLAAWTGDHSFLADSWNVLCGTFGLRSYDIETGQRVVYWDDCYTNFAVDPVDKVVMLSTEYGGSQTGTYLATGTSPAIRLGPMADNITWSSQAKIFLVQIQNGVEGFHPDGSPANLPFQMTGSPTLSPGGNAWAWTDASGTFVGLPGSGAVITVLNQESDQIFWNSASNGLVLCSNSQIYLANFPDYIATPVTAARTCADAKIVLP